ncbi:MAG: hypothetical protein D6744_00445 [Planctomycetota bacterium]|nr:MAG: hypothetical protein D6744_00445 [Planctomycetota bacterium]
MGALVATLLSLLLTGCQATPHATRAIWVTRFDYKSQADVERIVENCTDAGFNTILFQVRGNGTAFYRSNLEPWAEQFGFQDPGFDPLAVAIAAAHARGAELHAWVNVMPAWRGVNPPTHADQLYNKHPEWFWYDQHGNRQALSRFYVSLNPCLPEVRKYLVAVFEDLASRYEVDGLHLDYIRFPNEPPATPRGSGIDYPRDERTLAMFFEATGATPDDDPAAWDQWRTDCVTQLVAAISEMLRRTRPQAQLSAAVGSVRERALHHFQDGRRWLEDGLLDFAVLMNYTDDPSVFAQRIEPWLEIETDAPIVPGLWFGRHEGVPPEQAARKVAEQIEIARRLTGGFCVFAYSSLFDSSDEELTSQDAEQRELRAVRRRIILPVIPGAETDVR